MLSLLAVSHKKNPGGDVVACFFFKARLMLTILGLFVATEGKAQLMLMMLVLSVVTSQAKPG